MRIGYVVGGLGRGGAELQLLRLASGMVARGHDVHVVAYNGPAALDEAFRAAGVTVVAERRATRGGKVGAVRAWLRSTRPDVVHAVMKRASSVTVMARWPRRAPPVIASDMSTATYRSRAPVLLGSLVAFAWADRVVTQTDLNRASLERLAPWLRGKTVVVRNGLDTERFAPARRPPPEPGDPFVFCVVGTVYAVKNPLRVIEAAAELRRRGEERFRVDWFGRLGLGTGAAATDGERARAYARERGVAEHVVFHGDTPDIERAYRGADALLHASIQEGFPNAVAEGMACGLPIAVSRVSDLPQIVAEARNGFVFDETDPTAIADAMAQLMHTAAEERAGMGARSRELAVRWFRFERFLDDAEALYGALLTTSGRPIPRLPGSPAEHRTGKRTGDE